MKLNITLLLFTSFIFTLSACTGAANETVLTPNLEGPALIMFYTDN